MAKRVVCFLLCLAFNKALHGMIMESNDAAANIRPQYGSVERARGPGACSSTSFPALLLDHAEKIGSTLDLLNSPLLDLACGDGKNGLMFATDNNREIVLVDRNPEPSSAAIQELEGRNITFMQMDLETDNDQSKLPENTFAAILVFKYLHRPLFSQIRGALKAGGILVYETFNHEHPKLAEDKRPRNPNFLLNEGELLGQFGDEHGFEVLHSFEGIETQEIGNVRSISQIVSMKK